MTHFVTKDNMNIFRLPVGWQYLVGSVLGGTLNAANLAKYDQLVQACLATGASCIIDVVGLPESEPCLFLSTRLEINVIPSWEHVSCSNTCCLEKPRC